VLFDLFERDYKGPRGHTESLYSYLGSSSRPSIMQIRQLIADWFFHYPPSSQEALKKRFCSPNDIAHQGAFFELYLHELLHRLGFSIEVHPAVVEKRTHPEFLVSIAGKHTFYLEATIASDSDEKRAGDKRENMVYESIDKIYSPNFFIGVSVHGSPSNPPPGKKWGTVLERWLSTLDPDDTGEQVDTKGIESVPSITLTHGGWDVTFQAIPKSAEIRGKLGIRPMGLWFYEPQWCKDDEYIRNAIKKKATNYGNLGLPYIIAINVLSMFFRETHMVMDALFGDEVIRVHRLSGGRVREDFGRSSNGSFRGPKGPRNKRVSGVIICSNLLWGNITAASPILWHNPWATFPVGPELWPLSQRIMNSEKNKIEIRDGQAICEVLSLPDDWPGSDSESDIG
jgi:hypothetical protein